MQELIPPDHPFVQRVLGVIERHHKSGLHYLDCAHRAGISEDLALALAQSDARLRELAQISRDEERLRVVVEDAPDEVSTRSAATPTEIKHNYLKDLADAGLFRKSIQMVRAADVNDESGARVIEGHLRFVVKDLWPKESQSEHTDKVEVEDASEEELLKRLELLRERRLEAQGRIVSARKALEERAGGERSA